MKKNCWKNLKETKLRNRARTRTGFNGILTQADSVAVNPYLFISTESAPIKGETMREAGTIRERIFQALIKRYTADQEEALVKIDALIKGEVVPGHHDLTGDIDKLIAKVAFAAEKMATLRRFYGTN